MGNPPPPWLLAGGRLAGPERVDEDGWLAVRGDRIVGAGRGPPPGHPDVELAGRLVVPGFVDLHCHGGGGADYAGGAAAIEQAAAFHRRHGTTATLASLVSDSAARLRDQVGTLAEAVADGVVGGVHLEGPWLATARCGAHDPAMLRDPDLGEIAGLLAIGSASGLSARSRAGVRGAAGARPTIVMVTLAPERSGARDAVRQLRAGGIVVAAGHTDATYEQVVAAIDAGVTVATHLGNAMSPVHHRRPGALLALLDDPRVICEVINDGVHLHPAFVRHVARAAGPDRMALVTDAVAAAGGPDGRFRLGGRPIEVRAGVARVWGTATLAGSTLTMDEAFRRAVEICGMPIPDAVRATSTTPARVVRWEGRGRLAPGGRADLVVFDDRYAVVGVLAAGERVAGAGVTGSAGAAPCPG